MSGRQQHRLCSKAYTPGAEAVKKRSMFDSDCCLDYLKCDRVRSASKHVERASGPESTRQSDFESVHLERNCCASSRHPTIVCGRTL